MQCGWHICSGAYSNNVKCMCTSFPGHCWLQWVHLHTNANAYTLACLATWVQTYMQSHAWLIQTATLICLSSYMYTYVHTYIHQFMHVFLHVDIFLHGDMHDHTSACVATHICMHTCILMHVCMYTNIHVYNIYVCMHWYIHVQACMHIHTNIIVCV